ncbi:MAG TPA: hypothetical protein VK694_03480 [Verrucomicrobiae bacterium]|nr:hypothetical protein [Verrucomicrobiae bacterium]
MTYSADHPMAFLNDLFEIDEIAAVRVADKWAGAEGTSEHYAAAYSIAERQTAFPLCEHCRWPLVNQDEHSKCHEITDPVPEDDQDDMLDRYDDHGYGDPDDGYIDDPDDLAEIAHGKEHEMYNS